MPVSGEVGVLRHESFGATLHPPTTKSKLIHGAPSVSYAASDYILRFVAGIPTSCRNSNYHHSHY